MNAFYNETGSREDPDAIQAEQRKRREYMIRYLLEEKTEYPQILIPGSDKEQKHLLRSLMNLRMPGPAGEEFLQIQDAYLKQETLQKGIVPVSDLEFMPSGICLWQGDITKLAADAVVNAANGGMTGCYVPNHACIDNCIHTFAGIQMRLACAELMQRQGREEPVGRAKITPGFNLPAKYVIHTVGPVVQDTPTPEEKVQLASCYRSCLNLAEEYHLTSIAFCCISTGVFHFPHRVAAEIAVKTVKDYLGSHASKLRVVFNVYKDEDAAVYYELLC